MHFAESKKRFVEAVMFFYCSFYEVNLSSIKIWVNDLTAKLHYHTSVTSREHLTRCLYWKCKAYKTACTHCPFSLCLDGGWRFPSGGLELLESLLWPLFAPQSPLNPVWPVRGASLAVTTSLGGTRHTLQSAGSSLFILMTGGDPREVNTCCVYMRQPHLYIFIIYHVGRAHFCLYLMVVTIQFKSPYLAFISSMYTFHGL